MYFDAHTHLNDEKEQNLNGESSIGGSCVNGTSEEDWKHILHFCATKPGILVPSIGLHPWYINQRTAGWFDRLRETLMGDPGIHLGEIGLDKSRKSSSKYETQKLVCRRQLILGKELNRTISIHCVSAHGTIFEMLREVFPDGSIAPPMLLHAWSGSLEMTLAFCKYFPHCFFSFSSPKTSKSIMAVPTDRILCETDDSRSSHLFHSYNEMIGLEQFSKLDFKGLKQLLEDNFRKCFQRGEIPHHEGDVNC